MSSGGLLLGDVEHVDDGHRDDCDRVASERDDRGLLFIGRGERQVAAFEQARDGLRWFGGDDVLETDPIQQPTRAVHNIELVERDPLAIATDAAQMGQDLGHGPGVLDGHIVGGHQPTDRALGIAEKVRSDLAFLRREQSEQPLGRLRGEFFQQRGPVVRGQRVEHFCHVGVAERVEQLFLAGQRDVFEHLRGQFLGQDAQQHRRVGRRQVVEQLRQVGRLELGEDPAQLREVALKDQLPQFGEQQRADYLRQGWARVPRQVHRDKSTAGFQGRRHPLHAPEPAA